MTPYLDSFHMVAQVRILDMPHLFVSAGSLPIYMGFFLAYECSLRTYIGFFSHVCEFYLECPLGWGTKKKEKKYLHHGKALE